MGEVANTIGTSLTPTALWGVVGDIMPVVIPIVLFGFGFLLVKKVINPNKIKKGKAL